VSEQALVVEGGPERERRRIPAALRTPYDLILGRQMEEGRLSLHGLGPVSRQLGISGLVALGGMLVSLLFNEEWRRGALVDVGPTSEPSFLPKQLVPVTLVALSIAWFLILWGAYRTSLWVRLAVAALFLVLNASLARPELVAVNSSFALTGTPHLSLWTYWSIPVVLVLLPEAGRRLSLDRFARPLALVLLPAAIGLFFGASLWAQRGQVDAGIPVTIPTQLAGAILSIGNLLLPMVFVSVLSIVQLSYNIAEAGSAPFWRVGLGPVRAALVALVTLKLWLVLGRHAREWWLYLQQRPETAARTLSGLALLCLLALLARRLRPDTRASESAKERVSYIGALMLALPLLIFTAYSAVEEVFLIVFSAAGPARFLQRNFPANWVRVYSPIFWVALLAAAAFVLLRAKTDRASVREAALGIGVVGIWVESFLIPSAFRYQPGFNAALFDGALTIAVAAFALIRWHHLTARSVVWLGALTGFSWLMSTEGDFISVIGSSAGLPATIVLVLGISYALLTDSEFARRDGKAVPRSCRPLLWVGYLLLSATIINWALATHGENPVEGPTRRAFVFLGLPLAAWMLSWHPFAQARGFEEDEED